MKLSSATIYIVAVSLALSILSFVYFYQTAPTLQKAKYYEEYAAQLETEANKLPQAKKRKEKAKALVQQKANEWNQYVYARTPGETLQTGGIDLSVNGYQLSIDSRKFRNTVQRAINAQVKKGGVVEVEGPYVPDPADVSVVKNILTDYFHYPTLKYPVMIVDGTVTVHGTVEQIYENVRSWKNMPHYLATTDGLQITGTPPKMTGTYNVQVIAFMRGKKLFPSVPEEQGTATGGFGGVNPFAGGGNPFGRGGPPGLSGPPVAGAPAASGPSLGAAKGKGGED